MTHMRRRIIPPDAFADPYLSPVDKRLFVIGLHLVCEDSGCLFWDARTLRAAILVHDDVTLERVEELMSEVVVEGRVWLYLGTRGKPCAYVPDFKVWQAKKGWFSAPEEVPLPSGITITEYESKHNLGRVKYAWPSTIEGLEPDKDKQRIGSKNQANSPNPSKRSNEPNEGVGYEFSTSEPRVPEVAPKVPADDEPMFQL